MSLATSGGFTAGAGGAGMSMATSAHASAVAMPVQPNIPPAAEIPMGTTAAPANLSALGADLVDKSQQLSLKQVKDLSKMPIVAIDLYSNEPIVASFPPKVADRSSDDMQPSVVGKMKEKLALKASESSHKTFRKWLSKSKGYEDLRSDVLTKVDDESAVVIQNPELWMGLRRLEDGPDYLQKNISFDKSNTPAFAEEASQGVGITLGNGTLDGSVPEGDDFDRVVCKVRLHEKKKALTVLPEEMLQLLLNQAQYHVARKMSSESGDQDEVDNIMSYPCAIAVPAPYCNDQSIEALLDATGNTGVVFQRSVCALAGALIPGTEEKPNMISSHLQKTIQKRMKDFDLERIKNPDATFDDSILLLLAGVTKDTAECTAIEISANDNTKYVCPYSKFKVVCNVSRRHENPEATLNECFADLFETLDHVAPDAPIPLGVVSYGSVPEQKSIQVKWDKLKKGLETWEEIPLFSTKSDCVATGTAILGGVSHGRLSTLVQLPNKKKPKAKLAIETMNVAPVAVGVMINYHGGQSGKWAQVKTIFDFDRRVPAGPYSLDLSAAEAAVHREGKSPDEQEEEFLKAVTSKEGAKYIPEREQAALELRVQIVQKFTRDGEWVKIGDMMSPLTIVEKDETRTACEKVSLELSVGLSGLITQSLVGDRQSVVQATKSARWSAIQWYIGVSFAVLFFGGFLVKSWWEDRVFERDTRRLLAYYKHVLPGSMLDGDVNNARYVVYKYRNKKNKLWKGLEKKYEAPVLLEHEWEDHKEDEETDDEHEDLDANEENAGNNEEQDL
mmetsp:Transcript_13692/g.32084  ORF Transcript_13692/g.32084 Transcript_13692/m.32084 type:complete len:788 (-) Transcript_13692:877-3240(-)|eukprot:CAMPEP_0197196794 /NCGR_PEP_ID=MMETSP1423-20130617/32538_1 /TAXON_ID=476441 /ORGANISM="Pseudo-nitzschia heimii, Strain UNC1101" /LENGTH=787 /DNA_ID=CAMNT_0042650607 /DNA_START=93 /DNA_END=2456 /DNA_ORIENTATION=+